MKPQYLIKGVYTKQAHDFIETILLLKQLQLQSSVDLRRRVSARDTLTWRYLPTLSSKKSQSVWGDILLIINIFSRVKVGAVVFYQAMSFFWFEYTVRLGSLSVQWFMISFVLLWNVFNLQGVPSNRQADGAWRALPVVVVTQREAETKAQARLDRAQTVLLDVGERGQRLGDLLLLAAWRMLQGGTQILGRHRLHLSWQTRFHLAWEVWAKRRGGEGNQGQVKSTSKQNWIEPQNAITVKPSSKKISRNIIQQ